MFSSYFGFLILTHICWDMQKSKLMGLLPLWCRNREWLKTCLNPSWLESEGLVNALNVQFQCVLVLTCVLLCFLILTQIWWDLQVTKFSGLYPLHGEIGEGVSVRKISSGLCWFFLDLNVVFLDGLARKGDYCLLLFYREFSNRGPFLC